MNLSSNESLKKELSNKLSLLKKNNDFSTATETLLSSTTPLILSNEWLFLREEIIPLLQHVKDESLLMRLEGRLGTVHYCLGNVQEAEKSYRKALQFALQQDKSSWTIQDKKTLDMLCGTTALGCINNLANCFFELGDLNQAKQYYGLGLRSAEIGTVEISNEILQLDSLHPSDLFNHQGNFCDGLGSCAFQEGNISEAIKYYKKSLESAESGLKESNNREQHFTTDMIKGYLDRNTSLKAHAQLQLAICYRMQGNYDDALALHKEGIALAEQINNRSTISQHHGQRAEVFILKNDYKTACDEARKGISLATEISDPRAKAIAACALSLAALCLGDKSTAAQGTEEALASGWEIKHLEASLFKGCVALMAADKDSAASLFRALLSSQQIALPVYEKIDLLALGNFGLFILGEYSLQSEIEKAFRSAKEITSDVGITNRVALILRGMAKIGKYEDQAVIQKLLTVRGVI